MKNKSTHNVLKYSYLFLLLLCIQSCESLIEIDLPDDQINTEDVFKDIHTTQAALANLYTNVRQSSILAGDSNGLGVLLGYHADELISLSQANSNADFDFFNNSIQASNQKISAIWNTNYAHLYAINAFIEGLSSSRNINDQDKQLFLAEAHFLRALYYHYLTQIFGDIPYTTTTDYKVNTTISKTKSNEVLNNVAKDLVYAIDILPTEHRNKERIYPNKATAELLLAKNYLLQKQYQQAAFYAQGILDNYPYSLEEDLQNVFKKSAKSTIWQLGLHASGNATLEAFTYIFDSKPTNLYLSSALIDNFSSNDTRIINWIKQIKQEDQTWYHAYKYKNTNANNTDEYSIIFRIEEAYFVLIESLIYQNQIDKAIGYLNQIRQRANLSTLPNDLTQTQTIQEMLEESKREFFCEHGHRFLDLKRNNQLNLLKSVKKNWQDKDILFPIPEKEIIINSNLLPQNNGY